MLLFLLMFAFAAIIFYMGYYLFRHQQVDFMLFKPTSNQILSKSLKIIGPFLMILSVVILLLALSNKLILILIAMILGIVSTTGVLLFLLKFL